MLHSVPVLGLDRPRQLRYDINAFSDLEDLLGVNLLSILQHPQVMSRFSTTRALFWAGLKHEDPNLTPNRAGALIQAFLDKGGALIDIVTKIQEGIEASELFSKPKDNAGADNADPPRADFFWEWARNSEAFAYGFLRLLPWDFSRMTPGEFNSLCKGYEQLQKHNQRQMAWAIANIVNRMGTLKEAVKIEDLIAPDKPKETSPETLWEKHLRIKKRFGVA